MIPKQYQEGRDRLANALAEDYKIPLGLAYSIATMDAQIRAMQERIQSLEAYIEAEKDLAFRQMMG